ncbi:MAG: Lrp/AsnC family transcriptional regulator [Methanothrix sp.]|nr:Lrp/AsnC family transcriptional regulator [Methanothrix sp.]
MGRTFDIDQVDRTILGSLREDARISLRDMSRRSGISDATIQFRLKRMKTNGVIDRFTIMANPAATGYLVTAIILVQTDNERHDQVVEALAEVQEITEVYGILGEYDLFLKVWSRSLDDLNDLINDRIRPIEGIEDLHEIVVVERAKDETSPV